ncbi:MAG: hypothetical protein IPF92_22535 [Myxococcales bacterium]|nr:hypothetical protein [Myxococcales bacterium]MBL0194621.1 hypothetical protein [Myxococcales bacterium]HQY64156.1 hypothetical protein [Polyangiaceae bacterium]
MIRSTRLSHSLSSACVLALASLASLGASGCAANTGAPEADEEEVASIESALARENGGFTMADERPDFGDEEISSLPAFDALAGDKPALPGAALTYKLVLLWGHLPSPHDADDTQVVPQKIDWTGSVSVDAGVVGVSSTLRFDEKDAVAPRTEPRTVSFTSRTYPAVDGLVLRVAVPPGGAKLHFNTAAMNADIDLTSLARDVGGVKPLGDGRNGLAWVGFPDAPGCSNGFAFGHWSRVKPGLGKLKASIYDDAGTRIGRAKGIWGHAKQADKNLFFGKYITNEGAHKGLFGGTYGDGSLGGLWGNRAAGEGGRLQGFYSAGYDKTDAKGVWLGRWSEPCAR